MKYKHLKQLDLKIWNIIQAETERQQNELELIASENYTSPAVLEAMATVLTNKYSEGYPGKRYYGGNQNIDDIESLAIERAKKLFKAEHVNVQPLSGSPANAAVYMALLKPGDKVLGLKLDHGGHLSHGHAVNFSGILYNFIQYELNPKTHRLNYTQIEKLAKKHKPKMIVAGFSAYSHDINWKKLNSIAKKYQAFLFADIAHTAGLIAAELLNNPVPIVDVASTTTHKTLRGPRGAIIMCKQKLAQDIDRAVFPGMQGGPHDHITAAKAVALNEALKPKFKTYAKQVIKNAQILCQTLKKYDFKIISGGTDNHLIMIDLTNKNINGKQAEKTLESIGISTNRSTIPNDPNPPYKPSGLRLGTPAITTRGMKAKEIKKIAELIHLSIQNRNKPKELAKLKKQTKILCQQFPILIP